MSTLVKTPRFWKSHDTAHLCHQAGFGDATSRKKCGMKKGKPIFMSGENII